MNNLFQEIISRISQENIDLRSQLAYSKKQNEKGQKLFAGVVLDIVNEIVRMTGGDLLDEYVLDCYYSIFKQPLADELKSYSEITIANIYDIVLPALRKKGWQPGSMIYPTPSEFIYFCHEAIEAKYQAQPDRDYDAAHAQPKTKAAPKKPHDVIYLYEVHGTGIDGRVFKIGVTSSHCGRDRIGSVCKELKGTTFTELCYKVVDDALHLEELCLQYGTCPNLGKFGGYTEMRVFNDDELDEIVAAIDTAK